jgi:hypothetical protein
MSGADMAEEIQRTPTKNPLGMRAEAREFVPSTPSTCSSTVVDSVVPASSPSEAGTGGAWAEDYDAGKMNDFDEAQVWNYLPSNILDDFGIAGAADSNFMAEAGALQQWPLSLEQLPSFQPQDVNVTTPCTVLPGAGLTGKGASRKSRRRNRGQGEISTTAAVPLVLSTAPPSPSGAHLDMQASLKPNLNKQKSDDPRSQILTMCGAWGALVNTDKADTPAVSATVISIDPDAGISRRDLLRFKAVCAGKCPPPLATFKAKPPTS